MHLRHDADDRKFERCSCGTRPVRRRKCGCRRRLELSARRAARTQCGTRTMPPARPAAHARRRHQPRRSSPAPGPRRRGACASSRRRARSCPAPPARLRLSAAVLRRRPGLRRHCGTRRRAPDNADERSSWPPTLEAIANTTRANYFYAGTALDLKQVCDGLSSRLVVETHEIEVSSFFAAAGAVLALLAAGLSLWWFGRVV